MTEALQAALDSGSGGSWTTWGHHGGCTAESAGELSKDLAPPPEIRSELVAGADISQGDHCIGRYIFLLEHLWVQGLRPSEASRGKTEVIVG